jgi:hypothetical protein
MNKEQLNKLQKELNSISEKKFSKRTDKQLSQYEEFVKAGGYAVVDKLNKLNKKTGHWRKLGDAKIGVSRDEETKKKIQAGTSHSWRVILQFSKDGKLIKEWKNLASIRDELGFAHTNICACCQNKPKYKTAYGFIWKYKN